MPTLLLGVPQLLQDAATAIGNGNAYGLPFRSENVNVVIEGAGIISGGELIIEEADLPDYTGLWSAIQTIDLTDVDSDAQKIIHIAGMIQAIRARISDTVAGGGNVTVKVVCFG